MLAYHSYLCVELFIFKITTILQRHLVSRVLGLVQEFDFSRPFAGYLTEFFRKHTQMGARDRRDTKEWCYQYFRLGNVCSELPPQTRLAIAVFLCSTEITLSVSYILAEQKNLSPDDLKKSLVEKLEVVKQVFPTFKSDDVFAMQFALSSQIDKEKWMHSCLTKPSIYIRIRHEKTDLVLAEFVKKKIKVESTSLADCYTLSTVHEVDKTDAYLKGWFEFQDKMSQQTSVFFQPEEKEWWWDACAASGGKSLGLLEVEPTVQIFATDVRDTMLKNYKERLTRSGLIKQTNTCIADLIKPFDPHRIFDGIIADVPCSGSGTWSRNPEWLKKPFSPNSLNEFIDLQRGIITNILPYLKSGKPVIYLTCSAFSEENEENVKYFEDTLGLKTEKMEYLNGYQELADTMFVCRMIKA